MQIRKCHRSRRHDLASSEQRVASRCNFSRPDERPAAGLLLALRLANAQLTTFWPRASFPASAGKKTCILHSRSNSLLIAARGRVLNTNGFLGRFSKRWPRQVVKKKMYKKKSDNGATRAAIVGDRPRGLFFFLFFPPDLGREETITRCS